MTKFYLSAFVFLFAATASAELLDSDQRAKIFCDTPDTSGVDAETGKRVVVSTPSKDKGHAWMGVSFVEESTLKISDWFGGESHRLKFKNNTDAVFFKEKILKNPDYEIHYSCNEEYTGDRSRDLKFVRHLFVKNPKTGVQISLSDMLKEKLESRFKLLSTDTSVRALKDSPNPAH